MADTAGAAAAPVSGPEQALTIFEECVRTLQTQFPDALSRSLSLYELVFHYGTVGTVGTIIKFTVNGSDGYAILRVAEGGQLRALPPPLEFSSDTLAWVAIGWEQVTAFQSVTALVGVLDADDAISTQWSARFADEQAGVEARILIRAPGDKAGKPDWPIAWESRLTADGEKMSPQPTTSSLVGTIDQLEDLVGGISTFLPLQYAIAAADSALINWAGYEDNKTTVQYMLRIAGIATGDSDRLMVTCVAEWVMGFLGAPKCSKAFASLRDDLAAEESVGADETLKTVAILDYILNVIDEFDKAATLGIGLDTRALAPYQSGELVASRLKALGSRPPLDLPPPPPPPDPDGFGGADEAFIDGGRVDTPPPPPPAPSITDMILRRNSQAGAHATPQAQVVLGGGLGGSFPGSGGGGLDGGGGGGPSAHNSLPQGGSWADAQRPPLDPGSGYNAAGGLPPPLPRGLPPGGHPFDPLGTHGGQAGMHAFSGAAYGRSPGSLAGLPSWGLPTSPFAPPPAEQYLHAPQQHPLMPQQHPHAAGGFGGLGGYGGGVVHSFGGFGGFGGGGSLAPPPRSATAHIPLDIRAMLGPSRAALVGPFFVHVEGGTPDYGYSEWAQAVFGQNRVEQRRQLRAAAGQQELPLVVNQSALDAMMLSDVAACAANAKRQGWSPPAAPRSWDQAGLNFQMMAAMGGGNTGAETGGGNRSDSRAPPWLAMLPSACTTSVGKASSDEIESGYALSTVALAPLEQEAFVVSEAPNAGTPGFDPIATARRLTSLPDPHVAAANAALLTSCGKVIGDGYKGVIAKTPASARLELAAWSCGHFRAFVGGPEEKRIFESTTKARIAKVRDATQLGDVAAIYDDITILLGGEQPTGEMSGHAAGMSAGTWGDPKNILQVVKAWKEWDKVATPLWAACACDLPLIADGPGQPPRLTTGIPFYIEMVKRKMPEAEIKQMVCSAVNKIASAFRRRRESPCADTLIIPIKDCLFRAERLDLGPMVAESSASIAGEKAAERRFDELVGKSGKLAVQQQTPPPPLAGAPAAAGSADAKLARQLQEKENAAAKLKRAAEHQARTDENQRKKAAVDATKLLNSLTPTPPQPPPGGGGGGGGDLTARVDALQAVDSLMRAASLDSAWPCLLAMTADGCLGAKRGTCKRCGKGASWDQVKSNEDKVKLRAIFKAALGRAKYGSDAHGLLKMVVAKAG